MEKVKLDYLEELIDKSILNKLRNKNNIEELFPVQKVIIPLLVNQFNNINLSKPHDVCVSSPTGSGKTITFALPIIQYLTKFVTKELRVLIILPVTDLANQVFSVFHDLCQDLHINVASAIGNRPLEVDLKTIFFPRKDSNCKLINRAEILIATPGKLIELIATIPEFSLKNVQVLVIDEVDRILNSELEHEWIDILESSLYVNSEFMNCDCLIKQNDKYKYSQFNGCCLNNYSTRNVVKLLFSATLNKEKSKLDYLNLFEPLFFSFSSINTLEQSMTKFELPKQLKQHYIKIENDFKPAMIVYLMRILNYRKVICFIGRKEDAHRLNLLLNKFKNEFSVFELSSQISSVQRDKLKSDFSLGKIDLIICTDILARGIDLTDVNYVINYEPPHNVQAYVHRVGRTARGNKKGTAITLVALTEKQRFSIISRKTSSSNRNININQLNYNESKFKEICDEYSKLLESLKKDIEMENVQKKKQRSRAVKI